MADRNPSAAGGRYRRYRAPQATGATLIDPPAGGLLEALAANRRSSDAGQPSRLGLSRDAVRAARAELLRLAYDYTRQFCDVPRPGPAAADGPIILSGHQPDLFHPGVWFKNFALDRLAKASGGVGVHLLIDSDLCRTPSILCPTGDPASPRVVSVPYDRAGPVVPWEQRGVADPEVLGAFGRRVAATLDGLIDRPLAAAMQQDLNEAAAATGNLGQALSRARRRVESRWGVTTLELPLSAVCDSPAMGLFRLAATQDTAFADAYNRALADYRVAHKLRSAAQPMPDLACGEDWCERPFWLWTADNPRRRPLFVHGAGPAAGSDSGCLLSDHEGGEWRLASTGDRPAGLKVRTRALMTTLFARLCLGDLFLHGIVVLRPA
ncbi:MAG: hypothetical protein AAF790_03725, partial [Planctomycetota bacterium]